MLGRALSLAAVTLLIGCFAASAAWAQAQNLEAGKSPSQLFAGTCNACHKSPRGLLKTVSAGSLPGFLRQHYTTSGDMASQLSSFLISNGASDPRYQAKQGVDTKQGSGTDPVDRLGRRLRPGTSQEAARPDADGLQGRNAKRPARPGEAPDAAGPAAEGQPPAQAAIERGPDGRKQRLGKRGRPAGEELPSAKDEPPKLEPAMDDRAKAETAREEGGKPEANKPALDGKSEAAKIEMPKDSSGGGDTPVLRADPVPSVTPAPPAALTPPPAVASSAAPEPTAAPASAPAPAEPTPAVTASAPPPAPAGPPAPPISQ